MPHPVSLLSCFCQSAISSSQASAALMTSWTHHTPREERITLVISQKLITPQRKLMRLIVTEVKRAQRSSSQSEFEGRNWLLTCCRTLILSRDHRDAVNYSVSELHSTTYYYALLHITAYCCQPLQVNSNYIPPGSLILRLTLPGTDNYTLLYTIIHCYRQLHSAIHHHTLLTDCCAPLCIATHH